METPVQILDALIAAKVRESDGLQAQDLNLVSLANETEGFYPNDLKDLTERAVTQAAIRSAQQDGSVRRASDAQLKVR